MKINKLITEELNTIFEEIGDYTDKSLAIEDGFKSLNKIFGTNLTINDFKLTSQYPKTDYYHLKPEVAEKIMPELLPKIISVTGHDYRYIKPNTIELVINSIYLWHDSKYTLSFYLAELKDISKSTQHFFTFPTDVKKLGGGINERNY